MIADRRAEIVALYATLLWFALNVLVVAALWVADRRRARRVKLDEWQHWRVDGDSVTVVDRYGNERTVEFVDVPALHASTASLPMQPTQDSPDLACCFVRVGPSGFPVSPSFPDRESLDAWMATAGFELAHEGATWKLYTADGRHWSRTPPARTGCP